MHVWFDLITLGLFITVNINKLCIRVCHCSFTFKQHALIQKNITHGIHIIEMYSSQG